MTALTFPVWIPLGPWRLHPHWVLEAAAYFVGFRLYLAMRRRRGDGVPVANRWWAITAAAAGGALGSKLLAFDVRSVKKSCVHIVHPDDGRLIPFDTYNLFYRDDLERTRLAPLRAERAGV